MNEINADTDAVPKALQDVLVCGIGVVKFCLKANRIHFDHVPITEFVPLSDELKWRASQVHEKQND